MYEPLFASAACEVLEASAYVEAPQCPSIIPLTIQDLRWGSGTRHAIPAGP